MFTREVLRRLATAEPSGPIISICARTDPRGPANTSSTPAWHVALRNGLAQISERLEAGDERDQRLAFRELRERIEEELFGLEPAERARSVAWFLDAEGESSERFALQLPLRADLAVWDAKPFVSPLVDIADRGAPTGVVLVGRDAVRLLQIEQAEPAEPADSLFELELGDWRPFGGTAAGSPGRGVQATSHQESYEARVDAQRDQLFETAATQTARRLEELGWERVVLVCETQVASRFRAALPAALDERIVAESDVNLLGEEPTVIVESLEPLIEDAWLRRTTALVDLAHERARAGGAAALGAQETFGSLAEGRVEHLLLDPAHDFSAAAGMIPESIGGPPELLGERAVEAAIATGAEVTALPVSASDTLDDAGGIAALLRY
ncbi:MAG TPA: VLRF1 family aeRF1-type release factor [Solirubrobacteraceae bacterium]